MPTTVGPFLKEFRARGLRRHGRKEIVVHGRRGFLHTAVKATASLEILAIHPLSDAAELNASGKKIVVRLGTTAVDLVKTKLPLAEVVQLDQNAACLLEVTQRKADAFIYDQLSILKMQAAQPDATRALLRPLQSESWAMALTKENSALRDQINGFLREFRASGGFDRLATQYLRDEKAALAAQGVPFIFE